MKTITLELDDDLAEKLSRVSKEKRDMFLKIWVERVTTSSKSLSDLLEFSAIQARKLGVPDGKLNELRKS
jgi:hypothetical protein